MFAKTWGLTVVAFALSATSVIANDDSTLGVGTTVVLEMTGELATKYGQQTGRIPKDQTLPGLKIASVARIAQKLKDGNFRVESTTTIDHDGKPLLITLTAKVKPEAFKERVVLANTHVYSSPIDTNPVATKRATKIYQIQLSDLKGVKIRTWKLLSEVGD